MLGSLAATKGKPFFSMYLGLQVISYRERVEVWSNIRSAKAELVATAAKDHMPQPYHFREDLGWWVHASKMPQKVEEALAQGIRYARKYRP